MVGERIADRYELEELVGTGGMSSVYRARDTLLERNVALKILHQHYSEDEEYVERFRHEARTVAQLSHPHIVTVIDRGEEDGRQFIVFEYVDGENLKELIERTGPLPARRAIELALEIADGLAFAHQHGLVHRDVKPQNVLLTPDGEAKVTDFGIARSLDVEHGMTQTGTVLGTSNYIAPEQASGKRVDEHTDIYSLGVVVYELLTAEVPFPGENFVSVAMKHVNDPPPSLLEKRPDVPLRLAAAVDRALAKDPEDRFATMADFAAELRACLDDRGSPDEAATAIVRAPALKASRAHPILARRSRWPAALGLLALLGAAAVLGGVLALRDSNGGKPSASVAVRLAAVSDFDPYGGDGEHPEAVPNATDRNPTTYWKTSEYFSGLGKPGVGIIVDAHRAVPLASMTVTSDTPGFQLQIRTAASIGGPLGAVDSPTRVVEGSTTFQLYGKTSRYFIVWITDLGANRSVHLNEVRAG